MLGELWIGAQTEICHIISTERQMKAMKKIMFLHCFSLYIVHAVDSFLNNIVVFLCVMTLKDPIV